jgi:hypothetical protein
MKINTTNILDRYIRLSIFKEWSLSNSSTHKIFYQSLSLIKGQWSTLQLYGREKNTFPSNFQMWKPGTYLNNDSIPNRCLAIHLADLCMTVTELEGHHFLMDVLDRTQLHINNYQKNSPLDRVNFWGGACRFLHQFSKSRCSINKISRAEKHSQLVVPYLEAWRHILLLRSLKGGSV